MDMPERQEPGKLLVRASGPGLIPVERDQVAGAVDQHIARVQIPVAGHKLVLGSGRHQCCQVGQQADMPGESLAPAGFVLAGGVSELVPGRRLRNHLVPRVRLRYIWQGMHMQPAKKIADLGG